MPYGEMSGDKMSGDGMSGDEMSGDDMSCDSGEVDTHKVQGNANSLSTNLRSNEFRLLSLSRLYTDFYTPSLVVIKSAMQR